MSFNDHVPFTIDRFMGMYSRPDSDMSTPPDHAQICSDFDFGDESIVTRGDIRLAVSLAAAPIYIEEFIRSTGPQSWIYIAADGNMYHTGATVPGTPIHTFTAGTYFSMISYADRAYITPHNYVTGILAEFTYVYYFSNLTATWIFAPMAAAAPGNGAMTATTSISAGVVSAGNHVIRIAYEYENGFITKFSPGITYNAPGGKAIDLNFVPGGVARVVAVHIIVSPFLGTAWDGNPDNAEMFFLTRVAVVTPYPIFSLNAAGANPVNFYDSQLVSSADTLFDRAESVPAALGLCTFKNRLVLWGMGNSFISLAPAINSTLFVSDLNEPEAFDTIDAIRTVNPADGPARPISCCQEFRGVLKVDKRGKTYIQANIDGAEPIDWPVADLQDGALGTPAVNGFAKMEGGETEIHKESILVADWTGLHVYQGAYINPEFPLTWKIESIWAGISKTVFPYIQVRIQPTLQKIFVLIPSLYNGGAWAKNSILVADYSNGMDYQNIKWSYYTSNTISTPGTAFATYSSILIEALNNNSGNTSGLLVTYYGQTGIYRQLGRTASSGQDQYAGLTSIIPGWLSNYIIPITDFGVAHIVGVRVLGNIGISCSMSISGYVLNDTQSANITLSGTSSRVNTQHVNLKAETFIFTLAVIQQSTFNKIIFFLGNFAEGVPM